MNQRKKGGKKGGNRWSKCLKTNQKNEKKTSEKTWRLMEEVSLFHLLQTQQFSHFIPTLNYKFYLKHKLKIISLRSRTKM